MTAVEWLEQEFIKLESTIGVHGKMYELIEQAKEMEKQQIIDAAERWKGTDFAEKYYAETYGSKGSDDHIVDTNEMVSSQTEISDEDIEKAVNEYANVYQCPSEVKMCKHDIISAWKLAIEWYREQLKKQTQIGQG